MARPCVKSKAGRSPWCTDHKRAGKELRDKKRKNWITVVKQKDKLDFRMAEAVNIFNELASMRGGQEEANVCGICIEKLDSSVGKKVVLSECKHEFHFDCIRTWHEINARGRGRNRTATCPTCRGPFRFPQVEYTISDILMLNETGDKAFILFEGWNVDEGEWCDVTELKNVPEYSTMLAAALPASQLRAQVTNQALNNKRHRN